MRLSLQVCIIALLLCNQLQAKAVQRIIALSPHAVELLYAIGAGDRIVGTLEYANYPEQAQKIPRIGNYQGIQIEKVVALRPDLIIGWKSGNKSGDLKKLASLGLKIYYSQPKNIAGISKDLIELGKLTGLNKNAQVLADSIAIKHQKIIASYQNKKPVRVFYQLWHDPIRTIGPDNWNESLIADCNGKNVFNDADSGYPVVSLENVLIKNPQVIIIPHHSGVREEKLRFWDKWQNIEAVKNHKIFTLNSDLLSRFTPRAIEGLEQLCKAIDSARE